MSVGAATKTSPGDPTSVLDNNQLQNALTIISVGKSIGANQNQIVTALAVANDESTFQNYANDGSGSSSDSVASASALRYAATSMNYPHQAVGSDNDSVGLFQQRPSAGWLTNMAQAMDPAQQAAAFYGANPNSQAPGLLQVDPKGVMDPGAVAQAVQGSGTPYAYYPLVTFAQNLYNQYAHTVQPANLPFKPKATGPGPVPVQGPAAPGAPTGPAGLTAQQAAQRNAVAKLAEGNPTGKTGGAEGLLTPVKKNDTDTTGITQAAPPPAILEIGAKGKDVSALQQDLNEINSYPGGNHEAISVDGIFGQHTQNAVKAFQRNNNLAPTGVANAQTNAAVGQKITQNRTAQATLNRANPTTPVKASSTAKKASDTAPPPPPQPTMTKAVAQSNAATALNKANPGATPKAPIPALRAPTAAIDGATVAAHAASLVGTPHVWGGNTPGPTGGLDVAGIIHNAYATQGVTLPPTTFEMLNAGRSISLGQAVPGDVILQDSNKNGLVDGGGIYLGNGLMVTTTPGGTVTIDRVSNNGRVVAVKNVGATSSAPTAPAWNTAGDLKPTSTSVQQAKPVSAPAAQPVSSGSAPAPAKATYVAPVAPQVTANLTRANPTPAPAPKPAPAPAPKPVAPAEAPGTKTSARAV